MTTKTYTWKRTEDGDYELVAPGSSSPAAFVFDNGAGVGPSKGSGRWAVADALGKWIENVDTLRDAKAMAEREAGIR